MVICHGHIRSRQCLTCEHRKPHKVIESTYSTGRAKPCTHLDTCEVVGHKVKCVPCSGPKDSDYPKCTRDSTTCPYVYNGTCTDRSGVC